MASPRVSVIMPAHNAEAYIRQALASVLAQTYEHLEVLVVDDGSTDHTADVALHVAARDSRVRVLRQDNQGVAAARNLAIMASSGEYVAPIDADDIWYPRKIEKQVACMEAGGPSVGLVYTWWVGIDEEGAIRGAAAQWDAEGYVYDALLYVNFVGNASVPLIRRSCIEHVGGYNTAFRAQGGEGCEDWDLTLRIAEHYEFRVVPAYLSAYRAVPGSMSSRSDAMYKSHALILAGVRRRHPDMPDEILRWSKSRFCQYLASLSYNARDPRRALPWIRNALFWDPPALLSIGLMKLFLKSLARALAEPITVRLWPDQRAWASFRKRYRLRKQRLFTLAEVEQGSDKRSMPWAWKVWKPYDRLSITRWHQLTKHARPSSGQSGIGSPSTRLPVGARQGG